FKANVEQPGQLVHTEAIYQQRRQPGTEYTAQAKPPGLPERRLNFEPDRSLRAIPQPVAVTRHDAESVGTRTQVGVRGFPVRHCFTPCVIETLQPVTVAHPLRIA